MYLSLYILYFQLEDLPDELLTRILTTAIIKKILTKKPASSLTEVDSKQAISRQRVRLRGVSSNWNDCLRSEWFGDILDTTVNQLGKVADLRMWTSTNSSEIF